MLPETTIVSAQGVRLPRILYGTAWKAEHTADRVAEALRLGFRGIDTACQPKHYHEPGVGEGLAAVLSEGLRREEVYVQTKFTPLDGQDPARVPYDAAAPLEEQVAQSCSASLRNLRTDYLDGWVLHSPLADSADLLTVWQAMERLHEAGRVRQLGISNCYDPAVLRWLYGQARVKPAVVQNRFYDRTGYDREIREFCQVHGLVYQSFWTLTANRSLLRQALLRDLARRYGRSPEQVFFRVLTQLGIVPLTGTTSAEHMREDLAIFDFELADRECRAVDQLLR